jgi:DNA-binding transcriptional regulator YbjK
MKSRAAESLIPAFTEQVDRRRSLLQAAFDVIAMSGFEGLRTRAVAERAGVNIATLHYYFQPSKR